ncbi:MAG: biotin-dependent carboxyltransferase family protein [Pseudomonadota bacterium]
MSLLRVHAGGMLTTVQDQGRRRFQRFGVPVAGSLDPVAARLANALVGNPPEAAVLEMRVLGPDLECVGSPLRLAVVGATIAGQIRRANGEVIALDADRSFTLAPGDRVAIGPLRGSTTASLAVAGGVDVAPVMGSRSTFLRSGFGGLNGRALAPGDAVPVGHASGPEGPERGLDEPYETTCPDRIRVVLGPQDDHFTEGAIATLLGTEWRVSGQADRMGLRLDGQKLDHKNGHDIVSDGIVTGAIQVPGTGQPIVLLADRGTSGGYPKIATVIGADLPALGRVGPGAVFRFEAVTPAEGVAALRAASDATARAVAAIGVWHPPGMVDVDRLYDSDLISPPEDASS